MRGFLIALICSCGGVTQAPPVGQPTPPPVARPITERQPVDIIAMLQQPLDQAAVIVPGPASLVLGGEQLQALEGQSPREVDVLEEQGNDVHVGIRLPHVRFALWMARARMLGVLARDVSLAPPGAPSGVEIRLHTGAVVRRLARKADRTQVRYVGGLEAEGWIPTEALVDRGPAGRTKRGRVPSGRKSLMVMPGAIIRTEAKWASPQLAVAANSYFVDTINTLDDGWFEVHYEDDDITVHGFVSKKLPPGRVHKRAAAEPTPNPYTPNVTLRDQTCLYSNREPIGFAVGVVPAFVEKTDRVGWFEVTLDTPWGPVRFDAQGSTEPELAPCAR